MINKVVITKGIYAETELNLLVSFDEQDKVTDVINLVNTKIGTVCEACVEKVLTDIDACILKLSTGDKGFIENKKLKPEKFLERHSEKKLVCQGDRFWVQINQDKKSSKPYSCKFLSEVPTNINYNFIDYYIEHFVEQDYEIVSDLPEVISKDLNVRAYTDDTYSLWQLYDLTKLIDNLTSKISYIKNGGNIIIEQTEALTVIDVNSGKNSGKSTAMETNIQALEELARQIRLRSISGIIIVDLLKVSKDEEKHLMELFVALSKQDYATVDVHGITNLGLLEITRSRMFAPLKIN
ncbi:ribonuclease G [Pseudobutyrivibrio sp. YE44]|uniref:ribonuclease E/G n=1 Tax=Pseudobutyrivibrio sp. YE44 TaxID=1520802 RepID=UPI0008894148|nr:ribonuclease E/G [Pseudobutyrivibrio sp. YE44]SDB09424.1 ribonuclease G [Pseudobutyrivibrio sp. YE44]